MIGRIIRRALAVAVLPLVLAGTASAQNYDGTGMLRFGVFGAGEFYDLSSNDAAFGSTSLDGAAIGFSAGYDLVFARRMALGIETDLTVGDNGEKLGGVPIRTDFMATLRGRLGFFLTPDFLVYGTGGVAWAGLAVEDTISVLGTGVLDSNKTAVGWVAGGGLEYDFRDYFGTILFGEYLVGGFDTWKNALATGADLDADVHTFRIGVKFKVGHDYHADRRNYEPMK
jgi:outer membrane immunogenic protein